MNTANRPKPRTGLVAALDVGSTKVSCFIARQTTDGGIKVIGVGHQISRGVRNGVIVDMDAAEASIRAAVEAAEQMAESNVDRVIVSLTAGQPLSRRISVKVSIAGHQVGDDDLRQAFDPRWLEQQQEPERKLIHAIPISYSIDGSRGVQDPRGMYGESLGVNTHTITASAATIRNLTTCIARCHLEVESVISAPYASGLGCMVVDEINLGSALVDMGGGTTTVAVFYENELVHVESIPVGGKHVTNDIARGLSTTVAHAERIKTLYGSTLPSPSDDREAIKVPLVGEEDEHDAHQVPRSMLVSIIQPRLEETLELVRDRLNASGCANLAGRHVVLTGGACQLTGVREMAGTILDRQVRVGKPLNISGLPDATSGPAFSVGAGLLRYAFEHTTENVFPGAAPQGEAPKGPLGQLGVWFRETF